MNVNALKVFSSKYPRRKSGEAQMNRILTSAILSLTLVFASGVSAQDFDKGWDAYGKGDYATALREWKPFAEQGHGAAQFNLGVMYDYGEGVPQDDAEAVRWYRLAAEQGHASAQHNLGVMYVNGRGVPQDLVYTHMWFNIAAANGYENSAKNRDIVAGLMSATDISAAQKLARECVAKNYKGC